MKEIISRLIRTTTFYDMEKLLFVKENENEMFWSELWELVSQRNSHHLQQRVKGLRYSVLIFFVFAWHISVLVLSHGSVEFLFL